MKNFIQSFSNRFFIQKFFFVAFIFLIFFVFLFTKDSGLILYKKVNVRYHNKVFSTLVADTPQKQSRGLAVRSSMNDNEAMLFVFQESGIYPFWMKDMKFPIDILWLDKNKKIVFIKEHARPEEYPMTYTPDRESRYVLELVDGFVEKNNVKVGDIFKWDDL